MTAMAIILLVALVVMLAAVCARDSAMPKYWRRPCTGRAWKRAFPSTAAPEIRNFLQSFIDGFAFDPRRRLSFAPDDRVLDIYWRVKGLISDDMQLEFFAMELEARYGLRLQECWRDDITLSEVFEAAKRAQSRF